MLEQIKEDSLRGLLGCKMIPKIANGHLLGLGQNVPYPVEQEYKEDIEL